MPRYPHNCSQFQQEWHWYRHRQPAADSLPVSSPVTLRRIRIGKCDHRASWFPCGPAMRKLHIIEHIRQAQHFCGRTPAAANRRSQFADESSASASCNSAKYAASFAIRASGVANRTSLLISGRSMRPKPSPSAPQSPASAEEHRFSWMRIRNRVSRE